MSVLWNTLIIDTMTNALLFLYGALGNNFFLSIAVFTVGTRLIMLPLNMRQQRTTMRMQTMQPQIQAIQKKYKDNPQKMQEEFARIGYNPAESLAGCLPMLIQFPIFIGLYQAITLILGSTPQSLFELQERAYTWINLTELLPIANKFLWFNLGQPDPLFILPFLVFITMYVSQKLLTPAPAKKDESKKGKNAEPDNPMASMTQSMQYTMPIMFGVFSLQFPAGLSLYFVLSNLIGVGQGLLMKRTMPTDLPTAVKPTVIVDEAEEDTGSSADQHISAGSRSNGQKARPVKAKKRQSKRKRRAKR